jgi:thiamin-phosphate kinase
VESDEVNPTTIYGASKAEAERRVLKAHDKALILRTSAFFGPWDRYNFVWSVLNTLSKGDGVEASIDVVSPTYVPDLVNTSLDLLIDGGTGIWHMANIGETSWRDLAAMAAEPIGLLAGLALAEADAEELGPRIMHGVSAAAAEAGSVLLGGDLSRSPNAIILDIAVVGSVTEPVLRSGARAGDALWVTGCLGGAAAAVSAWLEGSVPSPEARTAFARPAPRLREARWLAEHAPLHALIDLSDGLAGDADHIAAASGVALVIEADAVPIHEAAGALVTGPALELALHGGEDYELLFAAPLGSVEKLVEDFAREFRVPLTRIGAVMDGSGVVLHSRDGSEQELSGGFDHFQQATS